MSPVLCSPRAPWFSLVARGSSHRKAGGQNLASTAYKLCASIEENGLGPVSLCGAQTALKRIAMADEDDEQEQDETPEPPQRLFTLTEAERARQELEPFLVEAIGCRKKLAGLENDLSAVSARIMMMGGVLVPYEKLATLRMEHTQLAETMKSALDRILETGCLIKDLDVGLLDFPAVIDNQDVYLCWKLGEDRIRFYHRQDEGFAKRKPLDPRDLGPGDTVQ
jgi:hypothetical protein